MWVDAGVQVQKWGVPDLSAELPGPESKVGLQAEAGKVREPVSRVWLGLGVHSGSTSSAAVPPRHSPDP